MRLSDNHEWANIKQIYPIGRKSWARVGKIRPFGIFVEVDDFPKDKDRNTGINKYIGLIEIVNIGYIEESQPLPLDYAQWPQEGTFINCMVCYYRERGNENNKYVVQLGLRWLGNTSQSQPSERKSNL